MNGTVIIKTILMLSLSLTAISCNSKKPTLEATSPGTGSGNVTPSNPYADHQRVENANLRSQLEQAVGEIGDLKEQVRASVKDVKCIDQSNYQSTRAAYGGNPMKCMTLSKEAIQITQDAITILELCHKGSHDIKMANVDMGEALLYTMGGSIVNRFTGGGSSSGIASELSKTIKDTTKSKISAVDHYNKIRLAGSRGDQDCLAKHQGKALDRVFDMSTTIMDGCKEIFNKPVCREDESPLGDTGDEEEEDEDDNEEENEEEHENLEN